MIETQADAQVEHTVFIKKIIAGGAGLGSLADGMAVMAPLVLPSETVRLRETKRKRSFVEGELLEILDASPGRRTPPCPLYAICGGCNLQHADPATQALIKTGILRECMERAHVAMDAHCPQPLLEATSPFGYRARIRLRVDGQGRIGFLRRASATIVPLSTCPVAAAPVNRALETLAQARGFFQGWPDCREVEILTSPDDGQILLLLHCGGKAGNVVRGRELSGIQAIFIEHDGNITRLSGPDQCLLRQSFRQPACTLSWQAGCFYQVNPLQNEQMVRKVLELAGDVTGMRILDLYCGMGNFSIPLALHGATGLGIEQNPLSIQWARHNSKAAGIDGWRFLAGRVDRLLPQCIAGRDHFDLILIDPPRSGIGKVITDLIRLGSPRICSISCDPVTQARDIRQLQEAGYRLTALLPVDMFPQTHHIESLALLEKN